jgi:hypothetical protein
VQKKSRLSQKKKRREAHLKGRKENSRFSPRKKKRRKNEEGKDYFLCLVTSVSALLQWLFSLGCLKEKSSFAQVENFDDGGGRGGDDDDDIVGRASEKSLQGKKKKEDGTLSSSPISPSLSQPFSSYYRIERRGKGEARLARSGLRYGGGSVAHPPASTDRFCRAVSAAALTSPATTASAASAASEGNVLLAEMSKL